MNQREFSREELRKNKLHPLQPLAMTRTEQNVFSVFESSAGTLGRIDNKKLREDIVRVYGLAKGVVDKLNAHSRDFDRWRQLSESNLERSTGAGMLEDLEIWIQNGLNDLQSELGDLLIELRENVEDVDEVCKQKYPVLRVE